MSERRCIACHRLLSGHTLDQLERCHQYRNRENAAELQRLRELMRRQQLEMELSDAD